MIEPHYMVTSRTRPETLVIQRRDSDLLVLVSPPRHTAPMLDLILPLECGGCGAPGTRYGWTIEVSEVSVGQPGGSIQVRISDEDGKAQTVEQLIKRGVLR